ncbi:MAG: glutaminyl-peptide cyclotransferase [Anaerolineae bacterium]|nr:glutaminyl-peptide cyclotransferase [Candidatus Roseilinea sp.]MDW8448584.1 glutaminyl-peptide cyclotransferase [Anaerolineae bacterium]
MWLALVVALAACATPPPGAQAPASPKPAAIPTAAVAPTERPLASPLPTPEPPPAVITYTYTVVNAYPHDPGAFTQGLVYADGVLYESTGLYGRSSLRRVALETGEVLQQRDLPAEYFGEGLALFDGRLIQLTWQNNTGFVYEAASFELQRTWAYPTEGWGLTHDGTHLIMSDGSATLRFLDPVTFQVQREVLVTDGGRPVVRLNELEYVNGEVFANVWQTDWVARIDPQSGRVLGWIDLGGLLTPEERQGIDVLNGIAYDAQNDRLFVTGKLWPKLFEITLVPKP